MFQLDFSQVFGVRDIAIYNKSITVNDRIFYLEDDLTGQFCLGRILDGGFRKWILGETFKKVLEVVIGLLIDQVQFGSAVSYPVRIINDFNILDSVFLYGERIGVNFVILWVCQSGEHGQDLT